MHVFDLEEFYIQEFFLSACACVLSRFSSIDFAEHPSLFYSVTLMCSHLIVCIDNICFWTLLGEMGPHQEICSAHTDFGTLTLLLTDGVQGLQVLTSIFESNFFKTNYLKNTRD